MHSDIKSLHCLWDVRASLGEGAYWSELDKSLYFVDIIRRRFYQFRPQDRFYRYWNVPAKIGFAHQLSDGNFVCGLKDGLYIFYPSTEDFIRIATVESELSFNRLNDGVVDSMGRYWFVTMDDREIEASGSVYRLDYRNQQWRVERCDGGYIVGNGPAVSPDGRVMYVAHTPAKTIYAFEVDNNGYLTRKRIFAKTAKGYPDGCCVDSEGNLWVCLYGGGGINRYQPDGSLDEFISLQAVNVTKLAFGGNDNKTVFVTTARKGANKAQLECNPLTGGIFSFRSPIAGQSQVFPQFSESPPSI